MLLRKQLVEPPVPGTAPIPSTGPFHFGATKFRITINHSCMGDKTRNEIVRELLAEMRAKLAKRDDAGVICLSQILATFTTAVPNPEQMVFGSNP